MYNFFIKEACLKYIKVWRIKMEIVEKRFTKKKNNNIIRKNYNPLNKELLKSYKREGLFMEEKDIVLKQIKEVLTLKEVEILKKI